MRTLRITAFLLAVFAIPVSLQAGSFALNEQSVSSLGVAFAGAGAAAEDASVLFYNPAGIVLLDQGQAQLGANYVAADADFENHGSRYALPGTPFDGLAVTGGNGGQAGVAHVIPNLYLTQPVFRHTSWGDLTVGVGLSVPFGLETNYDRDWVGRYQSLRTKLTTFDIQPTVSWRLWDRLSLGGSVDIQRASARLSQAVDFGLIAQPALAQFYRGVFFNVLNATGNAVLAGAAAAATQGAYSAAGFVPGGRDGVLEIEGDDWSVGFSVGALFEYRKANEGAGSFFQDGRVGVSYRSAIDHDIEGTADFRRVPLITAPGSPFQFPNATAFRDIFFKQSASAALNLPDIVRISGYQRFAQQFALLGDITWTHWSRLQQVPINFSNSATPDTLLVINYDDAVRYSAGLEWYATRQFTLRLGFAYDQTPIKGPEFRTPRVPDNDRYFVSAGLRWLPTDYLDVDAGYAHLFVETPEVDVTDTQGHNLRGSYDAGVNIVGISATYKWGGRREVTQTSSKDVSKDVAGYRK